MKALLTISLLAFSLTSIAASCFRPEQMPSKESKLPARICVEKFSVKLVTPELPLTPYYLGTIVTSAGTETSKVSFTEINENTYRVGLELPFVEIDNGACGSLYKSDIIVEFAVDKKSKAIEESLVLYATEFETYDMCHSDGTTTIINYTRI